MKDYVAEASKSKSRVGKKSSLLSSGILHPYQQEGAEFLVNNSRSALWWQPGLGKTLTTLAMLQEVKPKRTLLVAPLRCVHGVWPPEIKKWCPKMKHQVLEGSPAGRSRIVRDWEKGILLVNYEKLPWLIDHFPQLLKLVDCIVFDEASKLKSPKSVRWKKVKKATQFTPRIHQLTGTPAPNGLLDIWSQVFLLDRGERLGRFMGHYKDKYFEADYMGWKFTPKNPDRIHRQVSGIAHVLRADGLVDMPELVPVTVPVDVWTKEYEEMRADGVTLGIMAESSATVQNKLRQLSNGFIYDEDKYPIEVHYHKISALKDLLQELSGQPAIVFYEFQEDFKRLKEAFPKAVVFDDSQVDRWNRGKIDVLLMSPRSAGHGLNMQKSGNNLIWYGPPWDLEIHDQAIARVWRQGQKAARVFVYYLTGRRTLDERVQSVLVEKDRTQADLLNALEEHQNGTS